MANERRRGELSSDFHFATSLLHNGPEAIRLDQIQDPANCLSEFSDLEQKDIVCDIEQSRIDQPVADIKVQQSKARHSTLVDVEVVFFLQEVEPWRPNSRSDSN